MKASIVLPNLNGAGWLKDCIDSLYAQTEQDFELIVIDNASTDQSLADARAYAARPNFTLVENDTNTGFSAAVNTGIRLAKAPYVLLFNNDAFAKPDMLANLLARIETDPRIFSVQAHMLLYFNPAKTDDAGDYITLLGWACGRGNHLPASRYNKLWRAFSACGGAALYRKSVFREIGYFDENFFAYLEDVDIGWRANIHGYKNYFEPAAACTHISGATTSGKTGAKYNAFKSIQGGRNNLLLPLKNMPLLMLLLNLPLLGLGYLIKTLFFSLRGFGKEWRQGTREALAVMGRLQKQRFRWRHLPNYIWIQWRMLRDSFVFIDYRIRRLLQKQ